MSCGRCHRCHAPIRRVLDGEEWCDRCARYQRPRSHGWARYADTDLARCPAEPTAEDVGKLKIGERSSDSL